MKDWKTPEIEKIDVKLTAKPSDKAQGHKPGCKCANCRGKNEEENNNPS